MGAGEAALGSSVWWIVMWGKKRKREGKEGLTGARCKTVERHWGVSWARSKARWLGGGYVVVDLDWWLQGGVV